MKEGLAAGLFLIAAVGIVLVSVIVPAALEFNAENEACSKAGMELASFGSTCLKIVDGVVVDTKPLLCTSGAFSMTCYLMEAEA